MLPQCISNIGCVKDSSWFESWEIHVLELGGGGVYEWRLAWLGCMRAYGCERPCIRVANVVHVLKMPHPRTYIGRCHKNAGNGLLHEYGVHDIVSHPDPDPIAHRPTHPKNIQYKWRHMYHISPTNGWSSEIAHFIARTIRATIKRMKCTTQSVHWTQWAQCLCCVPVSLRNPKEFLCIT